MALQALQLIWFAFGLVITVSIIAIGAYIGTLRALDTFYGDSDSLFLSEEFHGRQER
ncbi:hypothetical protein ACOZ4N_17280 [Halorientalis pallida]|uniref:hypothetical protein n=1 Tax=Halorientalis pallida TaxID=2479928 RepID=UPI003C6F12D5